MGFRRKPGPVPPIDPPAAVRASANGEAAMPPGIFEPPNSFLARAIGRHKGLVLAFAILGAVLGILLGLARQPTYTASASLQVGQVNPNSPGFATYTQSATALATAFSRAIDAAPVLGAVERKLALSPATASRRLSSEPIPLSPVFRVVATGPSEAAAVRLANVSTAAVITYVGKTNSSNPQARSLLAEYRGASLRLKKAQAEQAELEAGSATPARQLLRAEAASSAAQVTVEAIGRSYVAAVASQGPREGLVTLLAGASTASSDRQSKLALYGFLGFLAGGVIGCAAAAWRERRRLPRPATAAA